VGAESEDAAFDACHRWQQLGYLDGNETESRIIGGPFESDAKALADGASFVEG